MIKNALLILFSSILMGQSITLSSELVYDGFKKPVFVISYPTDASILYVVEQAGKIIVLDSGKKKSKPIRGTATKKEEKELKKEGVPYIKFPLIKDN